MGSDGSEPLVTRSWVYRALMLLVHPACWTLFRTRVEGAEHLPREGGAVIAANHSSWLDIPLIAHAAAPRHVGFVARSTLARSRLLEYIMRRTGSVLIERGAADRSALRGIAEHLGAGDLVAMYPEGTRSRNGQLGAFKGGVVLAARQADVPIIPCGISGAYRAWPVGRRWPRPGRIVVRFGEPLDAKGSGALEHLRAEIAALSGQESQLDAASASA